MAYEGYVDSVSDREIAGWIYDEAAPNKPLKLEILAGDAVVATLVANRYRPDLEAAGKGNGRHAFSYSAGTSTPGGGPLSARIAGKRWRIQPTFAATGQNTPLMRDWRRKLHHPLEFGYPSIETGFTEAALSADEPEIVERLVEAFHRALAEDPMARSRETDLWSELESALHGDVLELLRNRDNAALADYLRDAHNRNITWGITQGGDTTATLRGQADARRGVSTAFVDYLVSLAEQLGLLDVESPTQLGPWAENLHSDPQELVDRIAARVGFAIETPPVMSSYFGIRTRDGILTGRDLLSLYGVLQVQGLARQLGIASPRVCEIGGGLGGVAYYCARLGMPCAIVDLPLIGVLQAYFLMRALGPSQVQLYGESAPAPVRLLPPFAFAAPGNEWDILMNQDSFPEMSPAYSIGYLRDARTVVRHAFYSVNQEARAVQAGSARQSVVRELVAQAGGWRRSSRQRHWLRPGYAEEIYRKAP